MPSALPAVPGAKVVKALERAGFTVTSVRGSHYNMRSVPVHAGQDMARGTLHGILSSIGMIVDEFRKLL